MEAHEYRLFWRARRDVQQDMAQVAWVLEYRRAEKSTWAGRDVTVRLDDLFRLVTFLTPRQRQEAPDDRGGINRVETVEYRERSANRVVELQSELARARRQLAVGEERLGGRGKQGALARWA